MNDLFFDKIFGLKRYQAISDSEIICGAKFVHNIPVILYGNQIHDGNFLRSLCIENPSLFPYVLPPLIKNPEKNGYDCRENHESISRPCISFNPHLRGDAYGRMAHIVQSGYEVHNKVMTSAVDTFFYDRVVCRKGDFYCLSVALVMSLFPEEPTNLSTRCSNFVPVLLNNTDGFRRLTGNQDEQVAIFTGNPLCEGLSTFMAFMSAFKHNWFALRRPNGNEKNLFTWSKGYYR